MDGYHSWWVGGFWRAILSHQFMNVYEWVNADLCCKVLLVNDKARKALYKYNPFSYSVISNGKSGLYNTLMK